MSKQWPVIRIKNPVTGKMDVLDMASMLRIDRNDLERECARQPAQYGWICAMTQVLDNEVKRLESILARKEDAAFNSKHSGTRISVTALKKQAAADPSVLKARKKLREAVANHALLKSVVTAWGDRGKQLTNLTILQRRRGDSDE